MFQSHSSRIIVASLAIFKALCTQRLEDWNAGSGWKSTDEIIALKPTMGAIKAWILGLGLENFMQCCCLKNLSFYTFFLKIVWFWRRSASCSISRCTQCTQCTPFKPCAKLLGYSDLLFDLPFFCSCQWRWLRNNVSGQAFIEISNRLSA